MLFYVPVEGVHKIGPLDVFFEAMSRFESRNDVFFDSSLGQDRTMWLNRGRLGFDYRTSEDTNIRVTYQYSNIQTKDEGTPPVAGPQAPNIGIFFNPGGNFVGRTRQDVPEAFVEHKSGDSTFRFGRQMVNRDWLVGSNDWGEVGRAWDGVSVKHGPWDMFAGRLDLDNPGMNDGRTYLYFGGYDWGYGGKTSLYYKKDQFTGASIYTAGHTYHKQFGNAMVGVNGAYQWGRKFGVDHEAWAAEGHVGFKFSDRLHGMVGYSTASGGGGTMDRNFDFLYPSDHNRLGAMDLVGLSNISAFSAGLGFQVNDKIGVSAMYHNFKLFDAKSPWFTGTDNGIFAGGIAGFDPSGASGDNLGSEFDFNVHVMLPSNLRLSGGYSFFDPGSYVNNVLGGNSNQSWFYASLGWRY